MSWFDEQIRDRMKADNEAFEDSFVRAAGIIMGSRLSAAMNDQRQAATDAIGEILKAYHIRPTEVPDSITDMNDTLEYLMRPHGIMRRNVSLEKGWYKDASGPMIGTLKDGGGIIALIPAGMSGYLIIDPKTGSRMKAGKKNEDLLDNEAIAFYKPFPSKKIGIAGLLRYILQNITPADITMIVAATLAVTLVGFLTPKMNELLFSDVIVSGSMRSLGAIGVFIICISISSLMLTTVKEMLVSRLTSRVSLTVQAASMMRILSLPADFFKEYGSGELANRARYIDLLVERLLQVIFTTGLTSLFSLAYISQIFVYAPALVTPAMFVILTTLAISVLSAVVQVRVSREQMKLASRESGMSYALISGIQKIKLSGAEKRAFARWSRAYSDSARLLYDPPTFLKVNTVLTLAVTLAGTIVIYYTAAKSGVSVSEYYAFNAAYGMISGAFTMLAGIALSAAQIGPILEMASPILATQPEVAEEKQVVEKLMGGIELNNVTFTYNENMPNVLENLSLKISPGQYVAIVGKTGCGKSTLMRILLGFEKPQRGGVFYDGRDIERMDLKSLRRNIGSVMQNGKLFTGDMYSNIVINNPRLTLDEAWEAAEMSGLADDIRSMPMGMFTLISEGMGGISGGQRQRLLIARAIAPKPRILMFDEATSALDNITQKTVSESLEKLKCTRIVIAHRLSTIRQCDRIIVLDKGHIIEDGSYDELIAKNGFFAELVERQRVDA
ncbi:MAG: NHLP bacteriocin export ABC transporter permease/ATPase subunit [Lachnospiraceae bacterium]|nr:NHLP bacteriocin export ABC transporter permease/ATPase subunit [Lachnospiraceae bacterium]